MRKKYSVDFFQIVSRTLLSILGLWGFGVHQGFAQEPDLANTEQSTQERSVQEPSTELQGRVLEEIIVTASKRKERLQDTPVAISALDASRIEQQGITSFADYASQIPNLALANGSTPGTGVVVIRGLYSGNVQLTQTSATYIGETPFTPSGSVSLSALVNVDPDLLDIERIEVLKGPQGTLYGASSLGGLIRIIPASPDPSAFSGKIRIEGNVIEGGDTGGSIRGSLNVPLSDSVALRVGVYDRHDPGFITNVGTGHDDLGSTRANGGSVALKAMLSPVWDAKISGLYQYSETEGLWMQHNVPGTGTPVNGERKYNTHYDGSTDSRYWLVEGTTNYEFDAGTLTGTVSYADYQVYLRSDASSTFGVLQQPLVGMGILPADVTTPLRDWPSTEKTTVELRFASKRLGSVEFLGGLFYTDENSVQPVFIWNASPPGVPLSLPEPFGFMFNNVFDNVTYDYYKEYAAFGNVTYYFTDDIDLTVGLRYAENDEHFNVVSPPGNLINTGNYSLDSNDEALTFQGSLRWRPTEDASYYFRVASGYRPGGPQTAPIAPGATYPETYKADTITSYELGAKGRLLDGQLSYDVAVYHEDWEDIQLSAFVGQFPVQGNGGAAEVDGAEIQFDWALPSGFLLGASLGYNKAEIKDVDPGVSAYIHAFSGDRLPGSPKVTASLYAEYQRQLTESLTGTIGAVARYQGDKESNYPGDPVNVNYRIPSYTTLDLRAGLDWQNYTADLRVTNVTDENGITGGRNQQLIPGTSPSEMYLIRPRMVAISFTARF